MVDLLIPGPEGKIEAKYHHNKDNISPIVLILHPDPSRGGTMNTKIVFQLYKLFANNGVNKNQIIFNGNSPRSEYLQFYNNIDIALDTFPINGGTTSFEAAYMGVPVLTKISEKSFWFRSGESINKNLSMNDWIAKDEEDYVSKAIKFSENKNYLINLKNELRNIAIKSPLFDSESFSNDFYEMLLNIAKR